MKLFIVQESYDGGATWFNHLVFTNNQDALKYAEKKNKISKEYGRKTQYCVVITRLAERCKIHV